jgi:hypothetical protein
VTAARIGYTHNNECPSEFDDRSGVARAAEQAYTEHIWTSPLRCQPALRACTNAAQHAAIHKYVPRFHHAFERYGAPRDVESPDASVSGTRAKSLSALPARPRDPAGMPRRLEPRSEIRSRARNSPCRLPRGIHTRRTPASLHWCTMRSVTSGRVTITTPSTPSGIECTSG